MLNPNVIIDVDDDVDNKIIPLFLSLDMLLALQLLFLMIGHLVTCVSQETLI